jgi:hypothetical protein
MTSHEQGRLGFEVFHPSRKKQERGEGGAPSNFADIVYRTL